MDEKNLRTPRQVAEIKGCSKSAVTKAIKAGRLPSVEVAGLRLVDINVLGAWNPRNGGARPGAGRPKKTEGAQAVPGTTEE